MTAQARPRGSRQDQTFRAKFGRFRPTLIRVGSNSGRSAITSVASASYLSAFGPTSAELAQSDGSRPTKCAIGCIPACGPLLSPPTPTAAPAPNTSRVERSNVVEVGREASAWPSHKPLRGEPDDDRVDLRACVGCVAGCSSSKSL